MVVLMEQKYIFSQKKTKEGEAIKRQKVFKNFLKGPWRSFTFHKLLQLSTKFFKKLNHSYYCSSTYKIAYRSKAVVFYFIGNHFSAN